MCETKNTVLIIGTKWLPGSGELTVPAIQKEIGIMFVKNGRKVLCTVLDATEEEKNDALHHGIDLLLPIIKHRLKCKNPTTDWLILHESYFPSLQNRSDIGLIIGHATINGTADAARCIQSEVFPACKFVNLFYTIPEDTRTTPEMVQEAEKEMLECAKYADLAVSLGPRVWRHYNNKFRIFKTKEHIQYIPFVDDNIAKLETTCSSLENGIEILSVHPNVDENCLLGYTRVAHALAQVAKSYKYDVVKPVWKFIGYQSSELNCDQCINYLKSSSRPIGINFYPPLASLEDLRTDFHQCQLVVFAPESDPFGLIALMASIAGVPFLTTSHCGFADFLLMNFPDIADNFIVQVDNNEVDVWEGKLMGVVRRYQIAYDKSQRLKGILIQSATNGVIAESHARFLEWCCSYVCEVSNTTKGISSQMQGNPHPTIQSESELQPQPKKRKRQPGELEIEVNVDSFEETEAQRVRQIKAQTLSDIARCLFSKVKTIDEVPAMKKHLDDIGDIICKHIDHKCLVVVVECLSLSALKRLWQDYKVEKINSILQEDIVSEDVLRECGASKIVLTTTIERWQYRKCCLELQEGKLLGDESTETCGICGSKKTSTQLTDVLKLHQFMQRPIMTKTILTSETHSSSIVREALWATSGPDPSSVHPRRITGVDRIEPELYGIGAELSNIGDDLSTYQDHQLHELIRNFESRPENNYETFKSCLWTLFDDSSSWRTRLLVLVLFSTDVATSLFHQNAANTAVRILYPAQTIMGWIAWKRKWYWLLALAQPWMMYSVNLHFWMM
ncbi:uncharacterized protein LOC102807814 [Saccoglossus kowalevskii]